MKKTLINIGHGVVLSHAIAAILRNASGIEGETDKAIVVLNGGGHLPTERPYDELVTETEEATSFTPLSDYVPEIAGAMQALQHQMQPPSTESHIDTPPETEHKRGSKSKN